MPTSSSHVTDRFNPPPDPRPAETPTTTFTVQLLKNGFQSAAGPASGGNRRTGVGSRTLPTRFNPPPDPRPAETRYIGPVFRADKGFNPPPDPRPAETVEAITVQVVSVKFQSAAGPASGGNETLTPMLFARLEVSIRRRTRVRRKRTPFCELTSV